MAELEKELHFTVVYRGKKLQLQALAGSTLGDLGKEIVKLTGVAPHTLRLILPKRPPLQPMSEQHSTKLLYESGIAEVLRIISFFSVFSSPENFQKSSVLCVVPAHLTQKCLSVGSVVHVLVGRTDFQGAREIVGINAWAYVLAANLHGFGKLCPAKDLARLLCRCVLGAR